MVVFAACYSAIVKDLITIWSTNPLYSYGFIVPAISAYICWVKYDGSAQAPKGPDYASGVPLTLIGMVMLLIGRAGAVSSLEFASIVVTVAGLIFLVFGRDTFRQLWFPVAYLLLMVPIWTAAIDRLQEPSRLVSAGIATTVLSAIRVPVLQQGTNIVLPVHTLAVMRECSGVNQLVAMLAMVIPAAYLWLSGRIRRFVLVVLAVLITYASNGLRIALVGWLAFKGVGEGNLVGSYTHLSEGLVVATLGYVAVAACLSLLSRASAPVTLSSSHATTVGTGSLNTRARRVWLDIAVAAIMIAVGGTRLLAVTDVSLGRPLQQLPETIAGWISCGSPPATMPFRGVSEELVDAYRTSAGEFTFAGVDDELTRTYRNEAGTEVQLYVGYYRRQETGKELTADAAQELRLSASTIALESGSAISVGEVEREIAGRTQGLVFWYDIHGRIVVQPYAAKVYTIWDALVHGRTDGGVIMVAWQSTPGAQPDAARLNALAFARALIPVLRQYLPS